MNKRDVLSMLSSTCQKLYIDRDAVTIVGGAASLILGLHDETDDIDVHVTEKAKIDLSWEDAVKHEEDFGAINHMPSCQHYSHGKISFIYSADLKDYPTFNHRQYKVLTKLGLLMYRLDLGRTKDISDVKELSEYWDKLDLGYAVRLEMFLSNYGIEKNKLKENV